VIKKLTKILKNVNKKHKMKQLMTKWLNLVKSENVKMIKVVKVLNSVIQLKKFVYKNLILDLLNLLVVMETTVKKNVRKNAQKNVV